MIRSRAQRFDDMFDLFVLVLGAFAAVDVGNVNDRLFIRLQHLWQVVDVAARIEIVADVSLSRFFKYP